MKTEEVLGRLASAVPDLMKEAEVAAEVKERLRSASAAVLERAIELITPALHTLGSRPPVNVAEHYEHRCIRLDPTDDQGAGPKKRLDPGASRGAYTGCDLFLREDGRLVQFTYSGQWSERAESWDIGEVEYDSVRAAVDDGWYYVEDYVERLALVATAALGTRAKAIKTARQRAERLEAIAVLAR